MKRLKRMIAIGLVCCMVLWVSACANQSSPEWNSEIEFEYDSQTEEIAEEQGQETPIAPAQPTTPNTQTQSTAPSTKPQSTTPNTQAQSHQHNYTGSVTKNPTCTATGVKTFVCGCGKSYTEKVSALGHNWAEADCILPMHCTRCATTQGEALGHTTKNGTCSRCGKHVVADPVPIKDIPIYRNETTNYVTSHKDNTGKMHENCYYTSMNTWFYLGGEFQTLTAEFFLFTGTENGFNPNLQIICDGEVRYDETLNGEGDLPRDVSVDIRGVQIMQIKFSNKLLAGIANIMCHY